MKTLLFPLLLLLSLLILSCKSQKELTPYKTFRATQKTFASLGGNISYVDKGKGSVILLLHGVPSSSWLYRKMIDSLVLKGHRVIAPDMLGFGNSDSPKGYEVYNAKNQAKRLLALMNHLNIASWHHVFHDAGGLWTWELIKIAPKKIKTLVMLNTIVYREGFNPPIKMKKGFVAKISMWMYSNGITTNLLLKKLFKHGLKASSKLSKSDIEGYKTPLREGKTKGMYYFFSQTCHGIPDYSELFNSITIPTLVIWGKEDDMLRWKPQEDKITSTFNMIDAHILDAKHFLQEEKPNEINGLILRYLK